MNLAKHHAPHDADLWIIRDPSDWQGAAFTYLTENAAFDAWEPGETVLWCNPVEGFCRDMTGDFEDRNAEEVTYSHGLRAHERMYAAGAV